VPGYLLFVDVSVQIVLPACVPVQSNLSPPADTHVAVHESFSSWASGMSQADLGIQGLLIDHASSGGVSRVVPTTMKTAAA
jgi:hypothetical protein